jgi:ATP-dependent helicase/nuclease subunit A
MPQLGQAGRPLSAAERGVATHLLLQYMDFDRGRSRAGIKAEIERLRDAAFLSPREAEAVNVSAVERLFASALGARMLAAREPLREFRFSLLLDAAELYPGAEGEELLLQGVVDCCLEEDGELVVIDYKTDAVRSEAQIAERRALYTPQLRAYAAALERIFSKRVKECVLYFLAAGKACRVETEERRGALQKS